MIRVQKEANEKTSKAGPKLPGKNSGNTQTCTRTTDFTHCLPALPRGPPQTALVPE